MSAHTAVIPDDAQGEPGPIAPSNTALEFYWIPAPPARPG